LAKGQGSRGTRWNRIALVLCPGDGDIREIGARSVLLPKDYTGEVLSRGEIQAESAMWRSAVSERFNSKNATSNERRKIR